MGGNFVRHENSAYAETTNDRGTKGPSMSYVSSILVLAAFIGLACLPWLSRQLRFLQTRSWPTVQGSVDSAWVSTELQGKSTFFKGKLAYSYAIENQRYSGEIQRNFRGNETNANAWVADYPHGLPVVIRYSQSNASNSSFDERDQHGTG